MRGCGDYQDGLLNLDGLRYNIPVENVKGMVVS